MDLKSCHNGRYNNGEAKVVFPKRETKKNKRNEKGKVFLCVEKEKR